MISKASYRDFIDVYPELRNRTICIGNLIDYNKIKMLSEQKIEIEKQKYIFITIGRHDEQEKRLTRVIMASKKLKEAGFDFLVWFVGTGKDTEMYKELIKQEDLEENIKLLGVKKNPYPYLKTADAILLTSDYEGYPVVFQEAFVLNKPIITTDVSDAEYDVKDKYGIVTPSSEIEDIYFAMKQFIENGYKIKEKFDANKYNEEVIEKIEEIIKG